MTARNSNKSGIIFIAMLALLIATAFGGLIVKDEDRGTLASSDRKVAPVKVLMAADPVAPIRQASLAQSVLR
jgi:hypothetical protein